MDKFYFLPFLIVSFMAQKAHAENLKATADRLGQEATQIGFALGLLGLAIASICLIMGKQDAANRISLSLLGLIFLACAPALIKLIRSLG